MVLLVNPVFALRLVIVTNESLYAMEAPWPANAELRDGVFHLAGHPITDLATRFGTPAYLMDSADLIARARSFKHAFDEAMGQDVGVYYASKALSSRAVLTMVHDQGLRVDCSTEGELAVALAAGIPPAEIGLHGNNKSVTELSTAIERGVGRIIVDSISEIDLLNEIAQDVDATGIPVMVRLTTGVHAGGHDFIATAHEDQKFGLSIASGAGREAIERILASPRLNFLGLHSHIGSQILGTDGFVNATTAVLKFRAELQQRGIEVTEVDLGGGYGIAYLPGEKDLNPREAADDIAAVLRHECERLGTDMPQVSIEPGRAIVGPAGITVYEVGTIKTIKIDDGERVYVSVDGGMSDNIRPILYDANYTAMRANRVTQAETMRCRIVGKHCESGDILIPDIELPSDLKRGDLLIIAATGAYGRSLASNYNQVPRPPVVVVEQGGAREIIRRETIDDLLRLDLG